MDQKITAALEALARSQAGMVVALATFAEAMIKEGVIDADKFVAHLESPSEGLLEAGVTPAEMIALRTVAAFLKKTYGSSGDHVQKMN